MTDFKPGDRVRATLRENVVVGTYGAEYGHHDNEKPFVDIAVADGPCECQVVTVDTAVWHIEKVSPPLPTKVGAIVRRTDGQLFVYDGATLYPWLKLDGSGGNASPAFVSEGGFEVIFEGVEQ